MLHRTQVACAGLVAMFALWRPVEAAVVINQVYGGGGNTGSIYSNDFIELFNADSVAISLSGWSVQYASASGSTWTSTPLTGSLQPGGFLLIQEASGGANGVPLPAADAIGSIAMAATAGKVALVRTTTPLTGSCPSNSTIADLVGYGSSASCFRGSAPTIAPSNTNAVLRGSAGCSDTADNRVDFMVGPPAPRNTSSPANHCESVNLLNWRRSIASLWSTEVAMIWVNLVISAFST